MSEIPTLLMEAAIYYKTNQCSTSLAKVSRKYDVSIKRLRTQIKKIDRAEKPRLQIQPYPSPTLENSGSENCSFETVSSPHACSSELTEKSFQQRISDDEVSMREIKVWALKMAKSNAALLEEVLTSRQKIGELEIQVDHSRFSNHQELFSRDKEIGRLNLHVDALNRDYEVLKLEHDKLGLEVDSLKGCSQTEGEIEQLRVENEKLTEQVQRVKRLLLG